MGRIAPIAAAVIWACVAHPVLGAEEEEENQEPAARCICSQHSTVGVLNQSPMQSMEACQTAAAAIYDKGDDYSGPNLYLYCVADDGNVWAFDRWNEDN